MSWTDILTSIATSLLGMGIGLVIAKFKSTRKHDKAMEAGMCVLLRARLIHIYDKYVNPDADPAPLPVCPIEAKEEADNVYQAYSALGGNGTGTEMHAKIMST